MESFATTLGRSRRNVELLEHARRSAPERRLRSIVFLGLVAVALGGCHRGGSSNDRPPPAASIRFSPNAEPLSGGPLGHPKCEEALAGWFDRTDADHDGVIDRAEFLADSQRQFDRMDQHHAGYVTSGDLSIFRAPYESVPGADDLPSETGPRDQQDSPGRRRDGGGPNGGTREGNGGAGSPPRDPIVDTRADPVMSADKTLSFKVTLADFLAQANDIFNGLDHNHDGRVTRDMVLGTCVVIKK